MQRVITFGLLSVLTVAQGVTLAQSVDNAAVGAWTLNRAKSTFNGPVPYGRVMKFEVAGDAIKETTYTFSTDKPSVVVEFTARLTATISESELDAEHGVAETRGRPDRRAGRQDSGAGRGDGDPDGLDGGKVLTVTTKDQGQRGVLERSGLRQATTSHALLASSSTLSSAPFVSLPQRAPTESLLTTSIVGSGAVEGIEMKAGRASRRSSSHCLVA